MAPSFDCIVNGPQIEPQESPFHAQNAQFLPFLLWAAEDDESLCVLVEKEGDFMPREGYLELYRARTLDIGARREAVGWILKVHSFYGLGPLTAYLAVNYMDRFLSMRRMLIEGARFIFDAQTIQRMELLILSTLQWRMRSITPFSYLDYFASRAIESNNTHHTALISRAVELILSAVKELDLLEYRPSTIAATAVLCAADEVIPLQALNLKRALPCCSNVDKERMFGCYNLIQDIIVENSFTPIKKASGGSLSTTNSPSAVVDAGACFSEKTASSLSLSVEQYGKRRKLNDLCSNAMWVSEAQPC